MSSRETTAMETCRGPNGAKINETENDHFRHSQPQEGVGDFHSVRIDTEIQ